MGGSGGWRAEAGPGRAGGGGRGWGLAVTDGPDAVECFRKGGAPHRRRDFGHGVWSAADGAWAVPPAERASLPSAGSTRAGHAAGARSAESAAERLGLARPAGGEDRLGSARRGEGETSGDAEQVRPEGLLAAAAAARRFSPRRCSAV